MSGLIILPSQNRTDRSITPNKRYSTYAAAHRSIAAAGKTPRHSDDDLAAQESEPTSPDTIGTDQPTTPNVTILHRDQTSHGQQVVSIRSSYLAGDESDYELPILPAAAYDPTGPGYAKTFDTSEYDSPQVSRGYGLREQTSFSGLAYTTKQYSHRRTSNILGDPMPRVYDSMLPHDSPSDESFDGDEHEKDWDEVQHRYRFLVKGAEKEVSQALREYTGTNQDSSGVIAQDGDTDENSPPSLVDQPSRALPPRPGPATGTSKLKRSRRAVNFYNDSAIQSGWQTEDNGIRVPTSPPPPSGDGRDEPTKRRPWSSLSEERFTPIPLGDLQVMQTVRDANKDDRDDWETVYDEQAGSHNPFRNTPMGKRAGGSSIADYSDRLLPEGAQDFGTSSGNHETPAWWEKPRAAYPVGSMKATEGTGVSDFLPMPEIQYPLASLRSFNGESRLDALRSYTADLTSEGFVPVNHHGLSEQRAQQMLNNNDYYQHADTTRSADTIELTELKYCRENWLDRVHSDENVNGGSRHPFSWSKVKKEVVAQQALRNAEQARSEPTPVGRPLSGFTTLPFPLISLGDARAVQGQRRASGLEDQSETGNFVFHHSMVNRSDNMSTISNPRRPALTAGPDYYTPLSPTTGQMIGSGDSHPRRPSKYSSPFRMTSFTPPNHVRSYLFPELTSRPHAVLPEPVPQ